MLEKQIRLSKCGDVRHKNPLKNAWNEGDPFRINDMIVFNRLLITWQLVCRLWKLDERKVYFFHGKSPAVINFQFFLIVAFVNFRHWTQEVGRAVFSNVNQNVSTRSWYSFSEDSRNPVSYSAAVSATLSPPVSRVHPINLNFYSAARETPFIFRRLLP